jgi:hypothetical protein
MEQTYLIHIAVMSYLTSPGGGQGRVSAKVVTSSSQSHIGLVSFISASYVFATSRTLLRFDIVNRLIWDPSQRKASLPVCLITTCKPRKMSLQHTLLRLSSESR